MALFNDFSTIQANFGAKIQSCQLNFWLFGSVWLTLTLSTKHNFCISVLKMNEARFARLWTSFFSRKLNFTSSKNSSSHRTSQRLFFSSSSNQITSLLARLVFLTALHIVCRFSAKWRNSWDHIETKKKKKHDHDFFPASDLISTLTDSRKLFLKVSDFTSNYLNNSESKLWLIS